MQEGSNFYKVAFFTLLTFLIIAVAVVIAYSFGKGSLRIPGVVSPTTSPASVPMALEEEEVVAIPTTTPIPKSDEEQIKEAVYKKTGLTSLEAEVTVSKNTGTHATGGIKEYEAVGGAYWLAAKVEGAWVAVYDGQSTPECTLIAPYNFPVDMVPQCLNSSGNIVSR